MMNAGAGNLPADVCVPPIAAAKRTRHGGSMPEQTTPAARLNDEIHYRILRLLESRPDISQRQLAQALGVSLGKTNYCLQALVTKGWIKAENFKNSRNKIAYAYLLTPEGVNRKATMAVRFLKRKTAEFEAIKDELERLREEVAQLQAPACGDDTGG
jgi:EPS-associated MarR family transcriptional regulator